MATGFFHHIGTFLLFAATILLIITCISAPVVHDLSILKVELGGAGGNGQRISFGTFGYCLVKPNADDACSTSHIGYSPSSVLRQQDGTQFSTYADDSARALTRAMVLHPIACGINFIAFLLALGAGTIGSFLASVVALLAFLVTAIACIIDFVLFSIVKSNVNDRGAETGTGAYYGAAAWTILVSAICSLIGAVVVFFTCCSARRHKRRQGAVKTEYASPPRRRRFGIF